MKININQTITNLLNEDRSIKSTNTVEVYLLTPEAGKAIKNKKTGKIYYTIFSLGSREKLSDFEEIDKESE